MLTPSRDSCVPSGDIVNLAGDSGGARKILIAVEPVTIP
jgi:hypothetical protein